MTVLLLKLSTIQEAKLLVITFQKESLSVTILESIPNQIITPVGITLE